MVTTDTIGALIPGRLAPSRNSASASLAPHSWAVALLAHGGIAALLLAGSMSAPQPQPDSLPVFEIVIPAATAQPATQPVPAIAAAAIPEPATAISEPEPEPEPQTETPLPVAKPVSRPQRQPMPRHAQDPATESAPAEATTIAATAPSHQSSPHQAAAPQQAMPPYAPILLDWLGRHRDYPRAARLRRQEGMPRIGITLDTSGRILALTLVESCGFAQLDEAALAMARRAAPFPPPQLPRGTDRATFVVPVQFALQR